MTHQSTCTSYLSEFGDDVCFQGSIENNLFVIINKGKIAHIRSPKLHVRENGMLL